MPRIDDRQFDPLRSAREGRAQREGSDKKYYEEYGFAMSPEEYKTFNTEVTQQNVDFDQRRTEMMGAYDELSASNTDYDLGQIWEDTDTLTIKVPYKDRTGSHGEIPASAWKDFSNAISSAEGLRNRTYISAPLASDVPEYEAKLKEIQAIYAAEGDAYTEYTDAGDDSAYGEPGYSEHHDPASDLWVELGQMTRDAGYTSRFSAFGIGQGSAGMADRLMQTYNDLNTGGTASFNVIGSDEYRALYYGMADMTASVKEQWEGGVTQQYKENQAELDNQLADAELTLQGYIDEFQEGVGSFSEEYEADQAAREEAFSGLTIG